MVIGQVSALIGNCKAGVTYFTLWIDWTKDNWSWEEAEVNFWTSISSERVITFCFGNPVICNPNILVILSLEILMTICDNCSDTIELESGAKCSAHHMTNSGKWKTWGTMERDSLDSQTRNQTIRSFGLLKKWIIRSWRLVHDKMGSETSHCWSTSRFFSSSFTQCTVKATLMDFVGFIMNAKTILTYMIAAASRMESRIWYNLQA